MTAAARPTLVPAWLGALPLGVHLIVYFITCFLAAIPLAFEYAPLRLLVGYFAGVFLPESFDPLRAGTFWALLVAAPLMMALAYTASFRWMSRRRAAALLMPESSTYAEAVPPVLAFALSATLAVNSLLAAGVLSNVNTWWDYGAWVLVRWALFKKLGFLEFVNIYVWLPVSVAWMVLALRGRGMFARWVSGLALLLVLVLTLMLFQKKALMATLLLLLFVFVIERALSGRWSQTANRAVLMAVTGLVFIYLTMTVLPVWRETTTRLDEAEQALAKGKALPRAPQDPLVSTPEMERLLGGQRAVHVATYALLSPFTRTSLPAFYYADVFPSQHPFYGLDLGQDIVGLGGMPEDNRVVWDAMYPHLPGGSASAPFQFVLYSQVGLPGALIGATAVGAALGLGWGWLLAWRRSGPMRPVLGSLLILFAIYLALDAGRNSLLASYGVLWGSVLAGLLGILQVLLSRRRASPALQH